MEILSVRREQEEMRHPVVTHYKRSPVIRDRGDFLGTQAKQAKQAKQEI